MVLARRTERLPVKRDIVAVLLADKRSPETRRAYRADLVDFFGQEPSEEDMAEFFSLDTGAMAEALNSYKADLLARGLAEATVNRRLAAVKSLVRYGRRFGYCAVDPAGLVDSERVQPYRDTSGVSVEIIRRLLEVPDTSTVKGTRDKAILRLLWENGLRRAEVCKLDVPDFQATEYKLYIQGKGQGTQKQPVTVSDPTATAILMYLAATGRNSDSDGPLFLTCDRRGGGRLTPQGLAKVVVKYGEQAGLPRRLSPHRIRHSAITAALDETGGNIRAVQRFSRHAKIETVLCYDDNRRNFQGEVTELLSGLV